MQDEGFERPSRQAIRDERRKLDAVDRRRKLIGLPILAIGLILVATGLWMFRQDDEPVPTEVGGISVERTTSTDVTTSTTSTSTTTTAAQTTMPPVSVG